MDPYSFLAAIAKQLWDLYQNTEGKDSEKAQSMYDKLENSYLEPFRKSQIQADTAKYAELTKSLQADITLVNKEITRINKIADDIQKVAEYAAIFDQIIGVAAKLLV